MIRMNPTVPTMTGTIMPTIRMRRAVSLHELGAEDASTGPGMIASTSSTGIVAASVHRVTCL